MNSWTKFSILPLLMVITGAWASVIKLPPSSESDVQPIYQFTSRSFHPQLKLTVNSNPKALMRKGLFSTEVEWVPLDPMEYKNASGSQETISTSKKLHRSSNFTHYFTTVFTTSNPISISTSVPKLKSSDVLWINKLTSNVKKNKIPIKKFNAEGRISVESHLRIKSSNKSNVSLIPHKDVPIKRKWIPLAISIPPNQTTITKPIATTEATTTTKAATTTTRKNIIKKATIKANSSLNRFENSYYDMNNEAIPMEFLNDVVHHHLPNNHMNQPLGVMFSSAPVHVPRPTTLPPFSYATYSWSTNKVTKKPVKKPIIMTVPSTTYKVTAHPLFITTEDLSNELLINGSGGNLNLSGFDMSMDYDSEEIPITTKKTKPGNNNLNPKTTPNPVQNNDRNYYTTLTNHYIGYNDAPQYPTYGISENDHDSVNNLASFLVTISPDDIYQAQAQTGTATRKPTQKPTRGWGLNRLQRLLLAVGMSFIPTAAMAVLVGFPSLLAGRKKRESSSMYDILKHVQNLDKTKQALWMKNADTVLQKYCALLSKKYQKKENLRGNRAWNGVAHMLTDFIKSYWNESENMGEESIGAKGVVYFPTSSGSLFNTSSSKRKGNSTKVDRNVLKHKLDKNKINWDHFVCSRFLEIAKNNTKKRVKFGDKLPLLNIKRNRTKSLVRSKKQDKTREINSKFTDGKSRDGVKYKSFAQGRSQQPMTMIIIREPMRSSKETRYSEIPISFENFEEERSFPNKITPSNLLPAEHRLSPDAFLINDVKFGRWKRSLSTLKSKLKKMGLHMKIISTVSNVKNKSVNSATNDINSIPLPDNLPADSKIYIYHIISNPKANVTKDTKVLGYQPRINNETKIPVTEKKNETSKMINQKKHTKNSKNSKNKSNYNVPTTIFRIPIAIEDSTPEYMHILGKPIPWPLVNKITEQYYPEKFWGDKAMLSTTTEMPINKFGESSMSKNNSSPTTITIYSFHGLEKELIKNLLNTVNANKRPEPEETQSDENSYEDLPISVTTKRSRKPTRRPIYNFPTRRYRPVTIRPGIKIRPTRPLRRPILQPQVVDECDPEVEECDPFIPTLPNNYRPTVHKKPFTTVISTLEYLLQKLGLHGGLIPLVDLGNLSKLTNKIKPWLWKKRTEIDMSDLQFITEKPDDSDLIDKKREINVKNAENIVKNLLYKEISSLVMDLSKKKSVENNMNEMKKKSQLKFR